MPRQAAPTKMEILRRYPWGKHASHGCLRIHQLPQRAWVSVGGAHQGDHHRRGVTHRQRVPERLGSAGRVLEGQAGQGVLDPQVPIVRVPISLLLEPRRLGEGTLAVGALSRCCQCESPALRPPRGCRRCGRGGGGCGRPGAVWGVARRRARRRHSRGTAGAGRERGHPWARARTGPARAHGGRVRRAPVVPAWRARQRR